LSANTAMVADVVGMNLLEVEEGSALWASLGKAYRENMAAAGRAVPSVEVVPVKVLELDLVELDGPWDAICWLGAWTVVMGVGVKWGEFQSDVNARSYALREALCIAKAFKATKLLVFPSSEFGLNAYAEALDGYALPVLVEKLVEVASPIKLSIKDINDYSSLSEKITQFSEGLDCSFIVLELKPQD
jgi:hypothetical protein